MIQIHQKNCSLITKILDPDGKEVKTATSKTNIPVNNDKIITQTIQVAAPKLWSLETPRLYKAINEVREGKRAVDIYETTFGIRTIEYNTEKGFLLNGKQVKMNDFVIGDFMWTGIDYLGESWWPHKNANSGVLDICGFRKDGYYFYKSQWIEEPMIHLFPHWNWPERQGQVIPVFCYTNCNAVELFLNDKSFGEKRLEFPRQGTSGGWNRYDRPRVNPTTGDLFLTWDVPYEPGVLKAVGKRNDEVVFTKEIRTTGKTADIRLSVDRNVIKADQRDVAHVTIEIVDPDGNVVPAADNLVKFTVEGEGKLIGVDNGNPRDHNSYQISKHHAFNGLCLAIVPSTKKPGKIRFEARANGLKKAVIEFQARNN
jgi:beta-galactosidase